MFADVELAASLTDTSITDLDAISAWLLHPQPDSGLAGLLQPPAATCHLRDSSDLVMNNTSVDSGVDMYSEQSGSELGDLQSLQSISSLQAETFMPLGDSTMATPLSQPWPSTAAPSSPLAANTCTQHNVDSESLACVPERLLSYRRTYRSIITNDAETQVFHLVDDLISESLRPGPRDEFLAQTSMATIRGMAFFTNLPKEMQRMVQLQHHRVNDRLQRRTKRLQDDCKRKAGSDRSEGSSSPELCSPGSTPPRPTRRFNRRSAANADSHSASPCPASFAHVFQ
jgi:hypothetical protein